MGLEGPGATGSPGAARAGTGTPLAPLGGMPHERPASGHLAAALAAALALLCVLSPPARAQSPDTATSARRQQAVRLRLEQRFPEALAAYRALASGDGASYEDRFWVAKLESWTGRLAAAESAFVRLLEERPDDEDSRLALAAVRRWRAGPSAAPWEADLEYFGERLSGQPATHGATLALGARSPRLRWRGAVTVQEKFQRTESRVGGEMGLRTAAVELRWSAFVAPGAEVLPRQTYGLGIGGTVGRLVLGADYGFLDYRDADVHQAGPAVELYAGRHWLLAGRYRYSSTRFAGGPAVGNHGGSLTLGYLYGPANLLRIFGSAGGESFSGPSRELVGEFDAVTIGAAWRHFPAARLGLELLYARQHRSDGVNQDSYGLRLVQRW
jgi:YaiO family outer membrane protein